MLTEARHPSDRSINLANYLNTTTNDASAGKRDDSLRPTLGSHLAHFAMPTLLVLRGILFSMLLDATSGASLLFKPEFRNVVVRMI